MSNLFIATLGQEPQVVTLALDALLQKNFEISRVIVIHTDSQHLPIGTALDTLIHEFEVNGTYRGKVLFSHEVITSENGTLSAVASSQQINDAYAWLYQFIRHHKRSGASIKLSIAGGRKTLGLFAFSVAQLLFDKNDHVWHLVSNDTLRKSRHLHASPEDVVQLVDIPFMQWSDLPGDLRGDILGDHIQEAMHKQSEMRQKQDQIKAKTFLKSLTPAEYDLFRLLVHVGGTNKQIAEKLNKSPKTIANQLANIYHKFL